MHSSTKIALKSSNDSSPNCSVSIAIFLKIISFFVKVPVLSLKTYDILPNSSGIVLFLAIVSGIDLSVEIINENQVFATSKLTFKAIGIIELNNIINLIKGKIISK